jgi:serine protease Do
VRELTGDEKKTLKIANGVMVEASDGAAAQNNVDVGVVIMRVNNTEITGVKSFKETVARLDPGKPVSLLVKDENGQRFVTFRPEVG